MHTLSRFLWYLIHATLAQVSAQESLTLDTLYSFSGASLSSDPTFSLPQAQQLTVSIAICSTGTTSPTFLVNNDTASTTDIFEIQLYSGFGNWTGTTQQGGSLVVQNVGQTSFQVVTSTGALVHGLIPALPFLGDTTNTQALIYSHPFSPTESSPPTYPNYTLPPANLSIPSPPSSPPAFSLVIAPTSSGLASGMQTACGINSTSSSGLVVSNDLWLRNNDGWRSQWLIDGLTPSTNYTAYVIQDQVKLSGPIYFTTKSPSFPCPLVHSLPFCPSTSYAVPLLFPQSPASSYDSSNLPQSVSDPLLQYMTNFTTMLLTFACGRDLYSPLQTCESCQEAYRTWLCSVSFPRCAEPPSSSSSPSSPMPALTLPQSGSNERNSFLPNVSYSYQTVLPCLEVCSAADRACPIFLGMKCPTARFNAASSYGVGFIDGKQGVFGSGSTGTAQDRWGNVWCNPS
ncbi:stretch-activated Ca2+-permeable channel component-domain-containing protein [Suillus plorans]|uniref:Stretch-activated Ca2+-permeable channel component-domain-containing protein n=1 Tax=Suillus plorans TaxID=116603 RepID=A0A9P7APQ1_9AGAM|nr:stretch-activated Ca2+-permeable channel component-domain-containing protein [Suillus plorans]KAG1792791.1 stretch-activated Ca2+-permeable channel component-domain-containing protein [Suillus plorans]